MDGKWISNGKRLLQRSKIQRHLRTRMSFITNSGQCTSKKTANISSDTSKSAKREKRETYNYHLRNEERAEMIRNQNSQHPDGEVFINCHPLNEKNYK